MSLDIWIKSKCEHCGSSSSKKEHNYTYNCSPMWKGAGWNHEQFENKRASEMAPYLAQAIAVMSLRPDEYRAMNPPNGYGDYEGCLEFLRELLADCLEHPDAIVEMWR